MRSAAVVLAALALVPAARPALQQVVARSAPASPGTVVRSFVRAVARGDAAAEWRLLTPRSQRAFGGSLARFRRVKAIELEEDVRVGRARDLRIAFDDVLGNGWAVAVVAGTLRTGHGHADATFAAALRRAGATWRIDLSAPTSITPLGATGRVAVGPAQLAVAVRSRAPVTAVAMWVDRRGFPVQIGGLSQRNLTAYGLPPRPLRSGRHVVVAFASTGATATAIAWTIVVR